MVKNKYSLSKKAERSPFVIKDNFIGQLCENKRSFDTTLSYVSK